MDVFSSETVEARYIFVLGRIVIALGYVEQNLTLLLSRIINNPSLAANLTFGNLMRDVINALRAGFYSEPKSENATLVFEYMLSEWEKLHKRRNKNFHCTWEFEEGSKTATRVKLGHHNQGKFSHPDWVHHVPLKELTDIEVDAWDYQYKLRLFEAVFFPSKTTKEQFTDEAKFEADVTKLMDAVKEWDKERSKKDKPK